MGGNSAMCSSVECATHRLSIRSSFSTEQRGNGPTAPVIFSVLARGKANGTIDFMLTIISGTNRPESNTKKVTDIVVQIYRDLGVPLQLLDLQELPPDLFAPAAYAAKPPAFARFANAVLEADGLVVVMPEYNGSMPGVLKVFIDHLKFPESFESRPVCFVGLSAGIWGCLRGVEQLQQIFGYRNAYVFPKRVFLPGISNAFNAQGGLANSENFQRLREQAEEFTQFVEKIRGIQLRPQ